MTTTVFFCSLSVQSALTGEAMVAWVAVEGWGWGWREGGGGDLWAVSRRQVLMKIYLQEIVHFEQGTMLSKVKFGWAVIMLRSKMQSFRDGQIVFRSANSISFKGTTLQTNIYNYTLTPYKYEISLTLICNSWKIKPQENPKT